MKKITPYLLSLIVGSFFGYLIFQDADFNVKKVFASSLPATAFQLGVFNDFDAALALKENYKPSIIITDDDVYRIYYSILTNDKVILKMEDYLKNNNINYYLKDIVLTDEALIKSISEYEPSMENGSDNVLTSLNELIMTSYKGE
ncbi:MAG: hypothetical protein PHX04_05800 [Bacilli bacterium]|nr:hypothetical protein [Bacilli bacterium]